VLPLHFKTKPRFAAGNPETVLNKPDGMNELQISKMLNLA